MPARFTHTEKWGDLWFRRLPPTSKLLFLFLCDHCDIAGFWEIDYEAAAFYTGETVDIVEGAIKGLNKSIEIRENWLWVKNFIRYQKNIPLNPKNHAHAGILKSLALHKDLFPEALDVCDSDLLSIINKPLWGGCKGGERNGTYKCDFNIARELYPGRKRGLDTEFKSFCKKHKDWKDVLVLLLPAIEVQIADRHNPRSFTPPWKHFATWINNRCWEEEPAAEEILPQQLTPLERRHQEQLAECERYDAEQRKRREGL